MSQVLRGWGRKGADPGNPGEAGAASPPPTVGELVHHNPLCQSQILTIGTQTQSGPEMAILMQKTMIIYK